MKIGVIGSMQYTEKMMEICHQLTALGHEPRMSTFAAAFVGKNDDEKERIKLEQKYNDDAIRQDCKAVVEPVDAVLVANYDKHGIPNYIGGNAFIEMAYAYILGKSLYTLNALPDMPYYGTEIIGMKPTVLNGDLSKIHA